ncbi:MAG: FlgD immunoglobulin-like domain containing protein [Candidatus Eisenbacteria bacterium]
MRLVPALRSRLPALVPAALLALFGAGAAHAQGGVWSTIPVPGGPVFGVADGDSGRVLVAGNGGAFQFDGFRLRRLPIFSATTDSLKGNAILRARNGDTWFGHRGGAVRLRPDGGIDRYDATSGLGDFVDGEVTALAETPDGTIWAGTGVGGLSHFDGNSWLTLTTDQGLPSQSIASVAVDPVDGSLWVGCLGLTGGLAHVVSGAVVAVYNTFTLTSGRNVRTVIVTDARVVWFGTDAGIGRIEPGGPVEFSTAGSAVSALAPGANGETWYGTLNRGVGRLDSGVATFFPSGPPSSTVQGLFTDAAGALWVSTSAGLGRYEGASVLNLSAQGGLPSPFQALSVLRDRALDAPGDSVDIRGAVWIGTQSIQSGADFLNLARRVNGSNRMFGTADGLPPGQVVALAPADSGQVWVGAYGNAGSGLARMSLGGAVLQVVTGGLPSPDVFAVRRAGTHQAWVGTRLGVALVDDATIRPLRVGPAAVPDASVRGLDLDAAGRLWIATGTALSPDGRQGAGAVRFDPADSSFTAFNQASGLPTNNLTSVTVFADGDVWFGSAVGVIRMSGAAITTLTTAHGLPSNSVLRVVEGAVGEAWIATTGGLVQFDGANLTTYGVGDGLAGSTLNNLFADSVGVIAALRTDGAALFHPDRTPPRAEILTAPPAASGSRAAQFAVRGGDLDSGTRGILLSYQLDGRPQTPFADDVTSAAFVSLADGDHTFRLWAKDRALNATTDPETWTFTVDATPPRPIVQAPAFNAIVRDTVDVLGSVNDPRFAGYTIELRAEGAQAWDTLLVSASPPAPGAPLYQWNTRAQLDGVWELRVGALDSLGLIGYVQVTVTVDNFAPSASVTSPARVDHVQGGRVFTTFGEVELDVPPNAWPSDQIVVIDPLREPGASALPASTVWASGWRVVAGDLTLAKPATLIVQLPGVPAGVPVALYRVEVSGADTTLIPIGGVRSADGLSLSSTVSTLGAFAVLYGPGVAVGAGFAGARGLDCQPRVLSPNGGGYDTRLAISFDLGRSATGAVKVFDRAGRLVREVVETGTFAPGRNVVFWDGKDGNGRVVPSGLYVVAVRFDGATSVASVAVANR